MKLSVITAVAVLSTACSSVSLPTPKVLMTAPAPVSFDGDVADQATDYVFVLVSDANPKVAGVGMRAGEYLRLALPATFQRNSVVAISRDLIESLS